ncbi:MAG: TlpA family protein disulfide reductase [Cecembia sp.]
MKKLLFNLMFVGILGQTIAQQTVHIYGQIDQHAASDIIFLIVGENGLPIEIAADGSFSANRGIHQFPSYFYLSKLKGKKLERQTPNIWFESNSIKISLNLADKSFETAHLMPYQQTSEKLESLGKKELIKYITGNPNQIPSLYFAERYKESIPLADLEMFYKNIQEDYKSHTYGKRIENYLSAKQRAPIKKGQKIEDFHLPDKEGKQVAVIGMSDKPKLISLFSSGCAYSVLSIDLLEKFSEMNDNNMDIITIWEDGSEDIWLNSNTSRKEKITWYNLWDAYGFTSAYFNRNLWPTFYVVNENGELIDTFRGYSKKTLKRLEKLAE